MIITCPKCKFVQPKDDYCANCGVDLNKIEPQKKSFFNRLLDSVFFHISLFGGVIIFVFFLLNNSKVKDINPFNNSSSPTSSLERKTENRVTPADQSEEIPTPPTEASQVKDTASPPTPPQQNSIKTTNSAQPHHPQTQLIKTSANESKVESQTVQSLLLSETDFNELKKQATQVQQKSDLTLLSFNSSPQSIVNDFLQNLPSYTPLFEQGTLSAQNSQIQWLIGELLTQNPSPTNEPQGEGLKVSLRLQQSSLQVRLQTRIKTQSSLAKSSFNTEFEVENKLVFLQIKLPKEPLAKDSLLQQTSSSMEIYLSPDFVDGPLNYYLVFIPQ